MMNASGHDWERLSAAWRAAGADVDVAPLRRLIAAERRRLAAIVTGECLIVVGFVWLSWRFMRDGIFVWEAVWLSTLWMFTLVALPFAWWNRRGGWRSLAGTVAEFRRQRAERRRRTLIFASALFVAETVVVLVELAWFDRVTALAVVILGGLALGFGGWALWMRRRIVEDAAAEDQNASAAM